MAVRKRTSKRPAPPARARRNKSAKPAARRAAKAAPNRRRSGPETLRLRSIEPTFTVNDLEKSVRFYTDVLGFIVADRYTGEGGALLGVMLKAGVCRIGLAQDDWKKGRDRQKGDGFRLWCQTAQDIDALADRIRNSGGRLTEEPSDQSWGVRSLSADDPDGYHLSIYRDN